MKQSNIVFRMALTQLTRERGMMIFYALCAVAIGIVVPFFTRDLQRPLTIATLLTTVILRQLLADSLAGERENKTLEALLSTSIKGKALVYGYFQCYLLFALCSFTVMAALAMLTVGLAGYGWQIEAWQGVAIIVLAVLNYSAIVLAGVYISARSDSPRTAAALISSLAYPLGLLYLIFISITMLLTAITVVVTGVFLAVVYLTFIIVYVRKTSHLKQPDYFENIKTKKAQNASKYRTSFAAPRSPFAIVFAFEWKYFLTLGKLLGSFGRMCFYPAFVACALAYFTDSFDLSYAVLVTVLIIPRVPTNLIAYSIGGEKAYKTGESLLSTPLHVRSVFLAKCALPVLISTVMLLLSALVSLAVADLYSRFFASADTVYMYSAEQLMLLFPVSIMSSVAMVLTTGVLSVVMKTPRQGLYAAFALGFVFVLPTLAIVYLAQNSFLWSVAYFLMLLIANLLGVKSISERITRPQLSAQL
ncbi:MAG: ABC transporter permease subunit [Lachnospiraceae bacterium]|nr:ABC transporter permease subunit [Lachnospiraceae bacterium]